MPYNGYNDIRRKSNFTSVWIIYTVPPAAGTLSSLSSDAGGVVGQTWIEGEKQGNMWIFILEINNS